jgi:uncharacterized protein
MLLTSSKKSEDIERIDLNQYKDLFGIILGKNVTLATISKNGDPNIVPIHSKHIISQNKILITDQFMNKTKDNVINHPYAILSIQDGDVFYRMSGKCQYESIGDYYNMGGKIIEEFAKTKNINIKCKGIIIMEVEKIQKIEI